MKTMRSERLNKNILYWQTILGPFPKGITLKCRDKRFQKGCVIGEIAGFYQYGLRWKNDIKELKPLEYSYALKRKSKKWWKRGHFFLYKRPNSVIRVIGEKER